MKSALQPVPGRDVSSRYALYKNDLPPDLKLGDVLAIDSEFMGLNVWRDRLCLLQIYDGSDGGQVHMVQFGRGNYAAPNVRRLLADAGREKIFYFARGDMRWIGHYLGVILENVYCLKIASRIARTYTQAHELEDVSRHVLGIKIAKDQQCTNWGAPELSHEQLDYACNDVLHLHAMKERLDAMLAAEGRAEIAQGLFRCLPALVRADLAGWSHEDIFSYHVPKPG
jgi:ribonuclease D